MTLYNRHPPWLESAPSSAGRFLIRGAVGCPHLCGLLEESSGERLNLTCSARAVHPVRTLITARATLRTSTLSIVEPISVPRWTRSYLIGMHQGRDGSEAPRRRASNRSANCCVREITTSASIEERASASSSPASAARGTKPFISGSPNSVAHRPTKPQPNPLSPAIPTAENPGRRLPNRPQASLSRHLGAGVQCLLRARTLHHLIRAATGVREDHQCVHEH